MSKNIKLPDRRQHPRYWVQRGSFAVPRASSAKVGRIINISRNGLAVRYKSESNWLNGASQIDIMLIDDDFYLSKLSAETILDNKFLFCDSGSMKEEKRCGLQFTNLKDYQLAEIDQFIQKFTIGRAWSHDHRHSRWLD